MAQGKDVEQTRRALAERLDCFTSGEFRTLANITENTEQAWRKRGTGPAYVLVGNEVLYPREPLSAWLKRRVRERAHLTAKEAL